MAARLARWMLLCLLAAPRAAKADVTHVVARGHTIEAIAHRYHVTVKSILDANHIKDANHLQVGESLTIPGASETASAKGKAAPTAPAKGLPATYATRSKAPGVIHATRLATTEDFAIHASTQRGHVSPAALNTFERMMRSGGGQTHPIEPRLVALLTIVSDHFGGRRLEIISGYRPYRSTQYTAHSNHNIGRAIDFRVAGVPNEVVRDYCRTLRNVGVGYYPNSTFVHLDSRASPAFWIDYSRPGEPPRYNGPNVDADEGTSDVAEESHAPEGAVSPENTPLQPLPGLESAAPQGSAGVSRPSAPSEPVEHDAE